MKIVYGVALPEQVRRLLDLAKCVGVDVEAIGVTGEHDLEEALSVPVAGPSALVIDIESLAQALRKWTPFVGQCGSRRKVESASQRMVSTSAGLARDRKSTRLNSSHVKI